MTRRPEELTEGLSARDRGRTIQAAEWLRVATSRPVVRGALGVSAVVGVTLNLINQGGSVVHGFVGFDVPRGLMNFVVPYMVSTWSAARVVREGRRTDR